MKPLLPHPPKTLCILRLSAIGDVSHVLPTLRILQKSWPETRITWVIGKTELALVEDIPGIEFIPYDKKQGWKANFNLMQALQNRQFDLLLNMQATLRANLASMAIKAKVKLGFDRERARGLQSLFTNASVAAVANQHVLDSFLEFPKALGLETSEIVWNIPIPQSAIDSITALTQDSKPFIVINPCSSVRIQNYRNWNITSYANIIDFAREKYGIHTVLTGGPTDNEKDYAREISKAANHKPCSLVGQTSLKELLAILKLAKVVIAPDTGPAHLANAVGTPVIGLYATSNPERTGPYFNRDLTVNCYPQAVEEEFGKQVAEIKWGQRVRNPEAMELISCDAVKDKLHQALGLKENNDRT